MKLTHRFVEFVPEKLEAGVLYVSITYGTASHLCCCGCGREVVTPIARNGWRLIYDGETVSLAPSIGNWNLPCKSHYWILENQVEWAKDWDDYDARSKSKLDNDENCSHKRKSFWERLWADPNTEE